MRIYFKFKNRKCNKHKIILDLKEYFIYINNIDLFGHFQYAFVILFSFLKPWPWRMLILAWTFYLSTDFLEFWKNEDAIISLWLLTTIVLWIIGSMNFWFDGGDASPIIIYFFPWCLTLRCWLDRASKNLLLMACF